MFEIPFGAEFLKTPLMMTAVSESKVSFTVLKKEEEEKERAASVADDIIFSQKKTNPIIYEMCGIFRQIFYNGKGYGVVTPETYRKTSVVENAEKGLLLSNEEALTRAHGAVESYPQGNVVHKAIQTNLVDVICRGLYLSNDWPLAPKRKPVAFVFRR